jgi:hypothetical protein
MDPHYFGKLDLDPRPDLHQSEKQYPDPHQIDADPQHCIRASQEFLNSPPVVFLTTKLSTLIFVKLFGSSKVVFLRVFYLCSSF